MRVPPYSDGSLSQRQKNRPLESLVQRLVFAAAIVELYPVGNETFAVETLQIKELQVHH